MLTTYSDIFCARCDFNQPGRRSPAGLRNFSVLFLEFWSQFGFIHVCATPLNRHILNQPAEKSRQPRDYLKSSEKAIEPSDVVPLLTRTFLFDNETLGKSN